MKQHKNGKSSQIFCFKLLKDGNLLCEAMLQPDSVTVLLRHSI